MINTEKTQTAVEDLLREDSPEGYTATIKLFAEAWFCSNHSDNTTSDERTQHFAHYAALKRFLKDLKKAGKMAIVMMALMIDSMHLFEI